MEPTLWGLRRSALRALADAPLRPLELVSAGIPRGKLGAVLGWACKRGLAERRGRRWIITEDGLRFVRSGPRKRPRARPAQEDREHPSRTVFQHKPQRFPLIFPKRSRVPVTLQHSRPQKG